MSVKRTEPHYPATTMAEETWLKNLTTAWILTGDIAELINETWPGTNLNPRTPHIWWDRTKRGGDGPLPTPEAFTGISERPMWRGITVLRWWANRAGVQIPMFMSLHASRVGGLKR